MKRSVPFFRAVPFSMAMAFASSAVAFAQAGSNGSLVSTTMDSGGAILPGAHLVLREVDTNDTFKAVSDARGTYTFVHLPIGTYQLTVSMPGFDTQVFDRITVEASQTNTLTAKLSIGEVSQTVEVTSDQTPVLEASSNEIGLVVDMKQIEDLPLRDAISRRSPAWLRATAGPSTACRPMTRATTSTAPSAAQAV